MKGLALFSGGLDSALAVKVAQEAGATVEALHFTSPFYQSKNGTEAPDYVVDLAQQLGVKLHVQPYPEDYLRVIENPRFGYGKNMNPCIDCRIYGFKLATSLFPKLEAAYLITGEVVGQRPNSQRPDAMAIIDRESGLEGLVLRPLSALVMKPTIPEIKGWVDRSKLLGIKGRSRKEQLALAERYGITGFATPAGGCLLTYKEYGKKIADLLRYQGRLSYAEVNRLNLGRHFRVSPQAKVIVGRNQAENEKLYQLAREGDYLLEAKDYQGPLTIATGKVGSEELAAAAQLTARYCDAPKDSPAPVAIVYRQLTGKKPSAKDAEEQGEKTAAGVLLVTPAAETCIQAWRI